MYTCPKCGRISHNPNDALNRYCGYCHLFEEQGAPELDRARIEEITKSILLVIRENYVRGPTSRDRCFEALNALAASAALVIEGSDGSGGKAHEFFTKAIEQHISDPKREKEQIEYAMALQCCAKAIHRLERNGLKRDAAQIREELAQMGIDVQIMADPTVENQ
jgi:hypothetical protein